MNSHLWPETSHGPAIPRRFALRYRYGDGPIMELLTPAVPNETYAVTVTPTFTGGISAAHIQNGELRQGGEYRADGDIF